MTRLPRDKYGFRQPIEYILQIPCIVCWIYLLMFHISISWISWILGTILGFVTAYCFSWFIFLIGYVIFTRSEKHHRKDQEDS